MAIPNKIASTATFILPMLTGNCGTSIICEHQRCASKSTNPYQRREHLTKQFIFRMLLFYLALSLRWAWSFLLSSSQSSFLPRWR